MHDLHLGTGIEFREYVYLSRVLKAFLIFQESFRIFGLKFGNRDLGIGLYPVDTAITRAQMYGPSIYISEKLISHFLRLRDDYFLCVIDILKPSNEIFPLTFICMLMF